MFTVFPMCDNDLLLTGIITEDVFCVEALSYSPTHPYETEIFIFESFMREILNRFGHTFMDN